MVGNQYVLELTHPRSESFFDLPPEPTFNISNITEWRKEIPTPVVSAQDFPFSSELQDMSNLDFLELKDTASECSMDSAYQSLSGTSRSEHRVQDGYPQDNRGRMNAQFGDVYSPTLSSDNYNTYSDQGLDLSQLPQSTSSAPWDTPDNTVSYATQSSGQDFNQFSSVPLARYPPSSGVSMSSPWISADPHFQTPFTLGAFPVDQSSSEVIFNPTTTMQRQWSNAQFEISDRPPTNRKSSSFTMKQTTRRSSVHDSTYNAFVATPTSTTSVHFTQGVDFEHSHGAEMRGDTEDSTPTSLQPQSLDEADDSLSQADAAESKLEEERTKVARSHPLYQQVPDKDGKYHCPEEGKTGCSHKPTPLKCNYDKYVDSHLKPFRCNKKTCVGVQFSSTACLLRHEREAHGMHGHGARPHLCLFRECERAVSGHGFPRRYNLFDHMKRVHQYDGPTTEPSPPVIQGQPPRKPLTRKRKSSVEDVGDKRLKVTKLTVEQQRQQQREHLGRQFLSKKQHIIDILTNLSKPSDLRDDIQLTKEVVGLHDICTKFRDSFGG